MATWLGRVTGNELTPALLVIAAATVTFATTLWLREDLSYAVRWGALHETAAFA